MKHWMIKKAGTFVLSTAAGLGVLSSPAAWGQDPASQPNSIQRGLAELFAREGRPIPKPSAKPSPKPSAKTTPRRASASSMRRSAAVPSRSWSRRVDAKGPALQQERTKPKSQKQTGQTNPFEEAAAPKAAPVPKQASAGIQAPVSDKTPKMTNSAVSSTEPMITPRSSDAAKTPTPPETALHSIPLPQTDTAFPAEPVVTPREFLPVAKNNPNSDPNLPEIHPFEMPDVKKHSTGQPAPRPWKQAPRADSDLPAIHPLQMPSAREAARSPKCYPFANENPSAETSAPSSGNPFAALSPDSAANPVPQAEAASQQPGLDGCCPVTLRDERKLVKGRAEYESQWEGCRYRFASADAKRKFEEHPEFYAPVRSGCDITQLADAGQEVAGSLEHAVWYQRQLYLFQSEAAQRAFSANPEKYARAK